MHTYLSKTCNDTVYLTLCSLSPLFYTLKQYKTSQVLLQVLPLLLVPKCKILLVLLITPFFLAVPSDEIFLHHQGTAINTVQAVLLHNLLFNSFDIVLFRFG